MTPFPKRRWSVEYTQATSALWDNVVALYHRAYGTYAGFRVHCIDDNSTNGRADQPTATDQVLALVSAGSSPTAKEYGAGAAALAVGCPSAPSSNRWPVRHSSRLPISPSGMPTGPSIQPPDASRMPPISRESSRGISKAAQAVITLGAHALSVGMAVHVSGVAGMTEINGKRALITAVSGTTITVAINSTSYGTYTSGGAVNTRPQAGEVVRGGCYFDIPARFNSHLEIQHIGADVRQSGSLEIVELFNP